MNSRWKNSNSLVLTVVLTGILAGSGHGQKVTYDDAGVTNAPESEYSVGYGETENLPRDYGYYYYGQEYRRPIVVVTPTPMPVSEQVETAAAPTIGYVKPYTDAQYANLVIQQMNLERQRNGEPPIGAPPHPTGPELTPFPAPTLTPETNSPVSQTAPAPSVAPAPTATPAPKATPEEKEAKYPLEKAVVVKVLDRGVMVTSNGLQIRLRGAAIPSLGTKNPRRKELAGRALAGMKELTLHKYIYFTVEKPFRGLDGRLLAIVYLRDGTELNRLALESGMATFVPGDFPSESDADNLAAAAADAHKAKRGLWRE